METEVYRDENLVGAVNLEKSLENGVPREQGRIEANRQQAWSDGVLTPGEACRLTREQNHASRDIWRAKHNDFHY
jgi:hypothetical protein